jgi:hypothetical protein
MAIKDKKQPNISVNYRRKGGTPIQQTIFRLCLIHKTTPNKLLDYLVQKEYAERMNGNG